ncbi:MAG: trigger factor [Candidatus Dojkabacteria bacterium]|nr:trigger factor [Candidatus Dojkabacteria bacterium]
MEQTYTRKDISKDTIELTITIPHESFKSSYEIVLKDYTKDTNIKGFRKGKVPSELLEPNIKENIIIETIEKLAPLYINMAIQKENLEIIAPPTYKEFPKIKDGQDIQFTITITILPEFKLGNLKKIKIKKEKAIVEDKEVEDAIEDIKKNRETKAKSIDDKWALEIAKMLKIENIKTLQELKEHIKDALTAQKEHMLIHKREQEALIEAIKLSKIEIPQAAIKYEASERERSFINDMQQRGVKVEDFLKSQNITMDKLRELWERDSKEALETDVFLKMYTKEKDIKITDKELKERIDYIKKASPDNKDTSIYEDPRWQNYVKTVQTKEKAFEMFREEVLGDTHKD